MEEELNPKVIFGLSRKATVINAIIILFISQLFWCLCFIKQVPGGFSYYDYEQLPLGNIYYKNIPWYVDVPFQILSMVMILSLVEHKYDIKNTDYSWKGIRYKILYPIFSFSIIATIMKIVILLILL